MIIAPYVETTLLDYSGITENTEEFDNTVNRFFYEQELRDGDFVYKRHGDDITIEPFDEEQEGYNVNDLVMIDGEIHYISATIGEAAKQPSEYDEVDEALNSNAWTHRYVKLGALSNDSLTKEVYLANDEKYEYKLFKNGDKWEYEVLHWKWSDEFYDRGSLYKYVKQTPDSVDKWCALCRPYQLTLKVGEETYDGEVINLSDGKKVQVVSLKEDNGDEKYFSYKDYAPIVFNRNDDVLALNGSSLDVVEPKAILDENDPYMWKPGCIIFVGNDVYVRTHINAIQETKSITQIQTQELEHIYDIDWGWTQYRPVKWLAPFDYKKYTEIKETNEISFLVESKGRFDVVVFNSIKASLVYVDILDANLNIVKTLLKMPKNKIIRSNKEFFYKTTEPLYLDRVLEDGDKVLITISPLFDEVTVGGIYLCDSIDMGKTDTKFKNSLEDLTPIQKDESGNIVRGNEIKIKTIDGSCYVDIEEYDDIIPIITDLFGKKVFFDISDNVKNREWDSYDYYSSGCIIGRLEKFEQDNVPEDETLSGNYSFRIVEDV